MVLRDASASSKRHIDYNINNLQFGYNRTTNKYWLSLINGSYRFVKDEIDEIIRDIKDLKINFPLYWESTINNLFHLKRLYRIKRLFELGYKLDFNEENKRRILFIVEKANEHRHGQPENKQLDKEWDKSQEEKALKESIEYHRKYPEGYLDPIVYPKLHTCSLSEPSHYDSKNIRTIKHPYTDFTLEFFLEDETMQKMISDCTDK